MGLTVEDGENDENNRVYCINGGLRTEWLSLGGGDS